MASGLIKGVGPHTARLLIEHFGMDVLEVIEKNPQRLQEVPGIGPKKTELIHRSFEQHKEIKSVMIFLQNYEISPSLAVRLFKHYGNKTLSLLNENPYLLAEEVHGIGFITADKVARKMGLPFNSPQRIRAAIYYVLNQAAGEGHVYLPASEIDEKVLELLFSGDAPAQESFCQELSGQEIFPELILSQLEKLARKRLIFIENRSGEEIIYSAPFYYAEKGSAGRLSALVETKPLFLPNAETVIQETLQKERLSQHGAGGCRKGACQNGVVVMTGGREQAKLRRSGFWWSYSGATISKLCWGAHPRRQKNV